MCSNVQVTIWRHVTPLEPREISFEHSYKNWKSKNFGKCRFSGKVIEQRHFPENHRKFLMFDFVSQIFSSKKKFSRFFFIVFSFLSYLMPNLCKWHHVTPSRPPVRQNPPNCPSWIKILMILLHNKKPMLYASRKSIIQNVWQKYTYASRKT